MYVCSSARTLDGALLEEVAGELGEAGAAEVAVPTTRLAAVLDPVRTDTRAHRLRSQEGGGKGTSSGGGGQKGGGELPKSATAKSATEPTHAPTLCTS
jgi:hypothetical protein